MLYQEVIDKHQCIDGIRLGIDKVVIGIPFLKVKLSSDVTDQILIDECAKKSSYQKKSHLAQLLYIESTIKGMTTYKKTSPSKSNQRCYSIFSDEVEKLLCTVTIGSSYGNIFVNIAFNPSKLTQENWFELEGLFSILFMNHYEELYEKGVVSKFEFFIDIADVNKTDLVLVDTGKRKTTLDEGSTYHGVRKSPLVCTMYDKADQQKSDGILTRIEARIHRRDIRFMDLVEKGIPNPFDKFFVVPADALKAVALKWGKPQLHHTIKEFGVYGGVKNPLARKKILNRLREATVSWWQPDIFWEVHQKLLLEFKPAFLGGCINQ